MAAPGSPESARGEGVHPGGSPGQEDGRIVGARYRLLRQLGAGGMGSVYLCEHVALGRRYAMKVLHVGQGRSGELSGRFRQEAQAASRIAQENVVQVVDYGEDEGGDLYYVMELLAGRTLSQLMREEGPLTLPRALTLLEQVCRALAAAHAAGVVHRDVKPDNVLVERLADGTERAKLIDFGISHLADTRRLTMAGEIIGTPEYMAPEQASGSDVDESTDVYAAGVLAFELLTGSLPLLGATPIATLVAHQTQPPPAPSTRRALPPEVDALVLRALAKAKGDRFPSMQAFAAEVLRVRISASLAAVARRTGGGEWSSDVAGTGRGGTIGLAAVPYPPADGPAPLLPAPTPSPAAPAGAPEGSPGPDAGPPAARPARRLRSLALAASALLAAALLAALASRLMAPPSTAAPSGPAASAAASGPAAPAAVAPAPPPEPPPAPVTPPRRLEEEPAPPRGAAPPRPARPEPLRDPYAAPADPLKPDPFR